MVVVVVTGGAVVVVVVVMGGAVVVVVGGGLISAVPEVISPVMVRSLRPDVLVQALIEAAEGVDTVTRAGPANEPVDRLVLTVVLVKVAAAPFIFPVHARLRVAPAPVNFRRQVRGLCWNDPVTVPPVMVVPWVVEVHLDNLPWTDEALVPPPEVFSEGRNVTVTE
jgi:hypothetical protein